MLEEIDLLLKEGIPPQELADAKKSYAANCDTMLADDDFVVGRADQGPVPRPRRSPSGRRSTTASRR